MENNKVLDMLLLPKRIYGRITGKKSTLFAGIIFVGAVDILFPQMRTIFRQIFVEKQSNTLLYNAALLLVLILVLGVLDVVFFSVPLFDLFKVFKKKKDSPPVESEHRIKIMKIYVIAHLVTLPVNILLHFLFSEVELMNNPSLAYTAFLMELVVIIWFNAVITRGINTIYQFETLFKRFVFGAVFLWSYMLGWALSFIIYNCAIPLFK
ncbi:MAG: hypothetical protein ACOX7R_00380 [Acetivibrionales bacterium]|jgi:hypothetical protein